jgi:hypothetical protein
MRPLSVGVVGSGHTIASMPDDRRSVAKQPELRFPPKKVGHSPEEMAKRAVARLPTTVSGHRIKLTPTLFLTREVVEYLYTRAISEGKNSNCADRRDLSVERARDRRSAGRREPPPGGGSGRPEGAPRLRRAANPGTPGKGAHEGPEGRCAGRQRAMSEPDDDRCEWCDWPIPD